MQDPAACRRREDVDDGRMEVAVAELRVPVSVKVTVGSDALDLEDWELFAVLRRKWDVKQEAVARAAGCSQPAVSAWERGRAKPSPDLLERLWTVLFGLVREERSRREAAGAAA